MCTFLGGNEDVSESERTTLRGLSIDHGKVAATACAGTVSNLESIEVIHLDVFHIGGVGHIPHAYLLANLCLTWCLYLERHLCKGCCSRHCKIDEGKYKLSHILCITIVSEDVSEWASAEPSEAFPVSLSRPAWQP